MFYMNNNTSKEDELFALMLTEAGEAIEACSNDLMVVAEAIIQSCSLVENMEEAHKDVLITRAEALKKLASLYKSRSVRFKTVA
jgi:ferritin-like metal-binding protein YciE